ncbi:OmpA family protein [Sphingomonas sabuli]|uniref:OmpA family protein n=1 Tax=Sphingomonas sabuli TaxID=2764186 RepID=A0A7G9L104_9SPHN|nr:OmpA family protein [Sphingomonas sabuli]QNM82303.1 OmpA family protein [Sphingomonas sabuli]
MNPRMILAAIALAASGAASAQPMPPPQAPPFLSPDMLQGNLVAASGSDTVYFPPRGSQLDATAVATLTAQVRWLLANPFVGIRLEGHGDARDSRDFALAIGEKRASEVRNFLVLRGISPARITLTSWGKERPGTVRIGPSTVAVGPRVVTVVTGMQAPMPPFPLPPQY